MVGKAKFQVDKRDENITHNQIAKIYAQQLMRAIKMDSSLEALPKQQQQGQFNFNFDIPTTEMSQISALTRTLQNNVLANNIGELNANLDSIENEYRKLEQTGQYDRIKRNINIVDNIGETTGNSNAKSILSDHSRKIKEKYLYIKENSPMYKILETMKQITEIAKLDFNADEIENKFTDLTMEIQYYLKSEKNYADLREALNIFVDELKTKYENNTQKKIIMEGVAKLLEKVKFIYSSKNDEFRRIQAQLLELKNMSVYNSTHVPSRYSAFTSPTPSENGDADVVVELFDDEVRNIVEAIMRLKNERDEYNMMLDVDDVEKMKNKLNTTPTVEIKNTYKDVYGLHGVDDFMRYTADLSKIINGDREYESHSNENLQFVSDYLYAEKHEKELKTIVTTIANSIKNMSKKKIKKILTLVDDNVDLFSVAPSVYVERIFDENYDGGKDEFLEYYKGLYEIVVGNIEPESKSKNLLNTYAVFHKKNETKEEKTAADSEKEAAGEPYVVMAKDPNRSNASKSFPKVLITKIADDERATLTDYFGLAAKVTRYAIVLRLATFLQNIGIIDSFFFSSDDNENKKFEKRFSEKKEELSDFILKTNIYLIPFVKKNQWEKERNELHKFLQDIYNNDKIIKMALEYYTWYFSTTKEVKFDE